MACESVCIECALSGNRDVKAYSEARQEMLRRLAELGKRLKARHSA
jgi:hypothetical protein